MAIIFLKDHRCEHCAGDLYYWEETDLIMVACYGCGKVAQKGLNKDDFDKWLNPGAKKVNKTYSMKEAYEINKSKDKCCVCGKNTEEKALFVGKIKYCPCVEELP